jgi:ABC-type Fe3+-hydroxamate transport system substrate-binding protein
MYQNHFTDQMGNLIYLPKIPTRIISLVPSQTELLFDLGLENEVVGITKFCVHPGDKVSQVTRVGGTKQFKFDVIDELQPDLIIGNKEENYKEGIEQLQARYPVWMSDIANLEDALSMMQQIGQVVGETSDATNMVSQIHADFDTLRSITTSKKALYLIWQDPYMVAGKGTFIDEMMQVAGFENLVNTERYPTLDLQQIIDLAPEVIMLSSEPYPFKDKHLQFFKEHLPGTVVELVNGEMFSWYGSRLLKAATYFRDLQHKLSNLADDSMSAAS